MVSSNGIPDHSSFAGLPPAMSETGAIQWLASFGEPAWMVDEEGHLSQWNAAFAQLLQLEADPKDPPLWREVAPLPLADLFANLHLGTTKETLQLRLPSQPDAVRTWLIYRFPVVDKDRAIGLGGLAIDLLVEHQVEKDLIANQARLQRLNRLHSLLSRTNETIIRTHDRRALCREACRMAVEEGRLELAWIGELESETGRIRAVTRYGNDDGYVDRVALSIAEPSKASGPAGRAIHSGMFAYTNHIAADPGFYYREEAVARGFGSCAAFPLVIEKKIQALLMVYAKEPGFFQDEELGVLSALADDLGFALQAIALEQERRKTERLLRRSEQSLTTLMSNLPGIAYRCCWDRDWTMIFLSEGCRSLTGYDVEDLIGNRTLSFNDLIHEEDEHRAAAIVRGAVESDQPFELTYRIRRADGEIRWVWERGVASYDSEVAETHLEGFITDITAQREAQTRIHRQAELLNKASDAIILFSLDGRVQYWNRGAEQIYGWQTYEVLGQEFLALIGLNTELEQSAMKAVERDGEWHGELRERQQSGGSILVSSRWTLIRGVEGEPDTVLRMDTDISAQRQMEDQLLRSQRLESIGALAGGIAHDLNNVLAPITISLDLVREGVHAPEHLALLQTIKESARRGAGMVQQILSFARGLESERVQIAPTEILKDLRILTRETLPPSIEVCMQVDETLPDIEVNPTQIHQVLLNLCVNARDAMPNGGELILRAFECLQPVSSDRPAGRYVAFEVVDTGVGMAAEIADQIFEPFFTTKQPGQGTGLGLSTTRSIICNHGGFIDVRSVPGEGSTFRIGLPSLEAKAKPTMSAEQTPPPMQGHGECVLVIEDEASIRSIVQQVLETFGYQALTAANGQDAVRLFEEKHETIDLVISDMMMPVLEGPQLVLALRKIRPDLRLIAISGLPADGIFGGSEVDPNTLDGFLMKPFSADTLINAVGRALQGKPTD